MPTDRYQVVTALVRAEAARTAQAPVSPPTNPPPAAEPAVRPPCRGSAAVLGPAAAPRRKRARLLRQALRALRRMFFAASG